MRNFTSNAKALFNTGGNPYMVPTYVDNLQNLLRAMGVRWDEYVNRNNPTYSKAWDTMMDENDPAVYNLLRSTYGY